MEPTGRSTRSHVEFQSFLYKLSEPMCILKPKGLPFRFLRWRIQDQWSAHCVCAHMRACACGVCVHVHASPLPCLEGILTKVRAGVGQGGDSHRIWCCCPRRVPELIPAEGCPLRTTGDAWKLPERIMGPSGSWSQAQSHLEVWGATGSLRTAGSAWW